MKTKIILFFAAAGMAFILLMPGCKMSNKLTYVNLAANYEPDNKPSVSGLRVFNAGNNTTKIFVRYNLNELTYKIPRGKEYHKAVYMFSYELFESWDSDDVLAHHNYIMSDSLYYGEDRDLIFDFDIPAGFPGRYLLEVKFSDMNSMASTIYPVIIYKDSGDVVQDFLPVYETGEVIFNNWIKSDTRFKLLCSNLNLERLYLDHFTRDFPAARPPFSMTSAATYQYEPMEKLTVKVDSGASEVLVFPSEGLFHFRPDTSSRNGFTLFRYDDDYPNVTTSDRLMPPLRYITTTKEYKNMVNAENRKQAVDGFWLDIAGYEERALELIKRYYSRVEFANWYFTSFKEGWKTDRGMIYIVFGPPQTVYRRDDIETWIYGERGSRMSLTFDFIRAVNPFTNEDFILQRQSDFKNPWYVAVDYWRR